MGVKGLARYTKAHSVASLRSKPKIWNHMLCTTVDGHLLDLHAQSFAHAFQAILDCLMSSLLEASFDEEPSNCVRVHIG